MLKETQEKHIEKGGRRREEGGGTRGEKLRLVLNQTRCPGKDDGRFSPTREPHLASRTEPPTSWVSSVAILSNDRN